MAQLTTRQMVHATLAVTKADGSAGQVEAGSVVWASSDETVVLAAPSADGMEADISSVAPGGPARFTVTADADLGAGVVNIIGVSEDILVTADPRDQASIINITLGAPTDKP
jgi:hypothetical protein